MKIKVLIRQEVTDEEKAVGIQDEVVLDMASDNSAIVAGALRAVADQLDPPKKVYR